MLETRFKERGTRFLIYPQPRKLKGFGKPVPVYVNAAPGTIKAGPQDESISVIDAVDKLAYKEKRWKPPYTGLRYPPAEPDADGHFDHIEPTERPFRSAAVYATVRCVLEIWEDYFGRHLPWYFRKTYPRIEVVPLVETDTAYSGDGYLEFGYPSRSNLLCENFDVVAHEVGHSIGWEVIGKPKRRSMAYRANDEACADLIAIVASLHFESVVDHLLADTYGHLFSNNPLSRVGEMGKMQQARRAFNRVRMSTVRPDPDPKQYKYNLSLPFTGGAFDVLVLIYQEGLVARRVISEDLARRSWTARRSDLSGIRRELRRHHDRRPGAFRSALLDARDCFGRLLARAMDKTPVTARNHQTLARNLIAADAELNAGRYGALIRESFERREILSRARR